MAVSPELHARLTALSSDDLNRMVADHHTAIAMGANIGQVQRDKVQAASIILIERGDYVSTVAA